jgi:hypothetical protein
MVESNLLSLLQAEELGEKILSFLDLKSDRLSRDLVNLDNTCKDLRTHMIQFWDDYGMRKFGTSTYGKPVECVDASKDKKSGLQRVAGLLRRPICFEIKEDVNFGTGFEANGKLPHMGLGSNAKLKRMACGSSYLVALSHFCIRKDEAEPEVAYSGVTLRDVGTLCYIKGIRFPPSEQLALCGKEGMEFVVASKIHEGDVGNPVVKWSSLATSRANGYHSLVDPDLFKDSRIVLLLGSESHLVVVTEKTIHLYAPNYDLRGNSGLLNYLGKTDQPETNLYRYFTGIRWSAEAASGVPGVDRKFGNAKPGAE